MMDAPASAAMAVPGALGVPVSYGGMYAPGADAFRYGRMALFGGSGGLQPDVKRTLLVLRTLPSFGSALEAYLYLLVPALVRLVELPDHHGLISAQSGEREGAQRLARAGPRRGHQDAGAACRCPGLDFSDYASRIVHPLVRVLGFEAGAAQEAHAAPTPRARRTNSPATRARRWPRRPRATRTSRRTPSTRSARSSTSWGRSTALWVTLDKALAKQPSLLRKHRRYEALAYRILQRGSVRVGSPKWGDGQPGRGVAGTGSSPRRGNPDPSGLGGDGDDESGLEDFASSRGGGAAAGARRADSDVGYGLGGARDGGWAGTPMTRP